MRGSVHYTHLISVIIPVYNMCEYLERCVNSVIGQTYCNLEIILVDDGSTDGSEKICDKYLNIDSRICVIHKKNGGLVSARKEGLMRARGKYIGFVDADDFIEKKFYEHLLDALICTQADIVQMGFIVERDGKKECFKCPKGTFNVAANREDYICNGLILMKYNNIRIFYNVWTKLYEAELIKKAYASVPEKQQYGEDLISTCNCLLECNILSTIPYEEYHYQLRDNSMSHIHPVNDIVQICHLYECLCDIFKQTNIYHGTKDAFDKFLLIKIIRNIEKIGQIHIPGYYFKSISLIKNKNIVIYGMGTVGRDYYLQLSKYSDIVISAVADGDPEKKSCEYRNIVNKESLGKYQFDLIIIAVLDSHIADNIFNQLVESGIPEEKIYWENPGIIFF